MVAEWYFYYYPYHYYYYYYYNLGQDKMAPIL